MERVGIMASKIARGNLTLYNFYVLLGSFFLSLLLFLLSGLVIFLGLWILRLCIGPFIASMSAGQWNSIFCYSLVVLTVLIAGIFLSAVIKNIKLRK